MYANTPVLQPQLTFLLHDAGETKALQPVMSRLDSLQVPYAILADGTARRLLKGNIHLSPLPRDVQQLFQINPLAGQRAESVLRQTLSAKTIVTGLVSGFQKRWTDYFSALGRRVVGYYDGFSFPMQTSPVDAFVRSLNVLLTAGEDGAAHFRQRYRGLPVKALGQATLDNFTKRVSPLKRSQVQQALNLNPSQPTMLFVGAYGQGYAEAFKLFLESVQDFAKGANVLVSLHPKVNGQLEQALIQEAALTQRVRIIPKAISTDQALVASDMILTHQSTMATQALFQKKPVFLVGQALDRSTSYNPILQSGLVQRFTERSALKKRLTQQCEVWKSGFDQNNNPWLSSEALYARLRIPPNATENISQFLLSMTQPLSRVS